MKRDVWATITFLITGVLFYLAQVEGTPQKVISSGEGSGVVDTMVIEESAPVAPQELLLRNQRTRDS